MGLFFHRLTSQDILKVRVIHLLTMVIASFGLLTTSISVSAAPEDNANQAQAATATTPATSGAQPQANQTASADSNKANNPALATQTVKPKVDANGYYIGGPVYVSDKNRIWTRSGPGEGYRITGSQQIGEKMIFKRYSENGRWAQLELNGESFWMPLDTLQPNSCGYSREAELTEQVNTLQYKLDNYDNELAQNLKTAEAERSRLDKENIELKSILQERDQTIQSLDEQNRDYAERLQTRELDMQMRWWMQGALIAFAGAIVGVIFIFIPRPSRKQKRERY